MSAEEKCERFDIDKRGEDETEPRASLPDRSVDVCFYKTLTL